MSRLPLLLGTAALVLPSAVAAQTAPQEVWAGMAMPAPDKAKSDVTPGMDMSAQQAAPAEHPGDGMAMESITGPSMKMQGMMGRYPMARESSGTAWQPDSAPMRGYMFGASGWSIMAEAWVTASYDNQGGPRGDTKAFSQSMAMLMASRDVSPADRVGLRGMLSLDPLMGRSGYPLLFATGETANGRVPLVDRQHPHDLFMELAGSWSHRLGGDKEISLYAGLPGEPALGPPTFMHRVSGMDDPEAPIGHHWFDSTHITYGVVTAGFSTGSWKIEASTFNGHEPDQHRWDIESPRLDSWSFRAFWNPTANLSVQLSTGHLVSPEQLEPERDEQRTTASITWNKPLGPQRSWATTLAWSNKDERPGPALPGLLIETALTLDRDEIYARAEHEQENELFVDGPLARRRFAIGKLSLGFQHEFRVATHLFMALGGLASAYTYPDALKRAYGAPGVKSFMLYGRLRFG